MKTIHCALALAVASVGVGCGAAPADRSATFGSPAARLLHPLAAGELSAACAPPGIAPRVFGWGDDTFSQSALPDVRDVAAIAAGRSYNLALRKDGTVVTWGFIGFEGSAFAARLSGVVAIAAGEFHRLALKRDGTVVRWGTESSTLEERSFPAGLSGVVAIAAGLRGHSLALRNDGTVVAWGMISTARRPSPPG